MSPTAQRHRRNGAADDLPPDVDLDIEDEAAEEIVEPESTPTGPEVAFTAIDWTPHAGLLIEPDVSHFAFIQAPDQFTADVERFLETR